MNVKYIALGLVVLSLLSAGLVGVASADTSSISSEIEDDIGWTGLDYTEDDVVSYGADANPSFIVSVESVDDISSLQSWADESESRVIHQDMSSTKVMLSAPASDIVNKGYNPLTTDGLHTLAYVDSITYNYNVSLIDPVSPQGNDELSTLQTLAMEGEWGSGQASDVETTTISEVKSNVDSNSISETGSGVTVGIIDTGLNHDTALYADRVIESKNFITGETGLSAVEDENGHGSWVASAVASSDSTYTGIAPDANLVIAKALSDSGSGDTADIVEAVEWTCERSDVVNMSLGSPVYSESIDRAVTDCVEGGTVVVAAAGNGAENPVTMYISSPADTPENGVVSVGATSNKSPSEAKVASFSEVGPDRGIDSQGRTVGQSVDVAAPGMEVETKVVRSDGSTTTRSLSGTSMASPVVTGVIAQGMESNTLSPKDVDKRIEETSARMTNGAVNEVGAGMINASNFVSNTTQDQSQEDVQNAKAESRNEYYKAYSGSSRIQLLERLGVIGDE